MSQAVPTFLQLAVVLPEHLTVIHLLPLSSLGAQYEPRAAGAPSESLGDGYVNSL